MFIFAIKEKVIKKGQTKMVSTLQIKKGLKCGNVTYIIALVENKANQSMEVPHIVA